MELEESHVEIGYLEKVEPFKLESRYFPSKIGGKPAWLDLKNIAVDISCGFCKDPCAFLCQVYAPTDKSTTYHRTIYVFLCRNPDCCRNNENQNLVVLRCQMAKKNEFYVEEEPEDEPSWHMESSVTRFNEICEVCGCLGSFRCGKCKSVNYCSKVHQVLHWKKEHSKQCNKDGVKSSFNLGYFLFPEYEIITEPEFFDGDCAESKLENKIKSEEEILKEYEELVASGKAGTIEDSCIKQLEELAMKREDKFLKYFKKRLSHCPDQVIRYKKGGEPLWIAEPNVKEIPPCEQCGERRQFEFQILPTLLSYLNVDTLEKSIDWGTLLIYTCVSNCDEGPSYKKEFILKQDIL